MYYIVWKIKCIHIKICNKPKQAILTVKSWKILGLEVFIESQDWKIQIRPTLLSVLHILFIPLPTDRTTLISSCHSQIPHIYQKLIVNKHFTSIRKKLLISFLAHLCYGWSPYLSLLVFKALLFCGKTPSQTGGPRLGDECSYTKKNRDNCSMWHTKPWLLRLQCPDASLLPPLPLFSSPAARPKMYHQGSDFTRAPWKTE